MLNSRSCFLLGLINHCTNHFLRRNTTSDLLIFSCRLIFFDFFSTSFFDLDLDLLLRSLASISTSPCKENPPLPCQVFIFITCGAVSYTLKNWDALTRYLDDGMLAIDNKKPLYCELWLFVFRSVFRLGIHKRSND